MFALFSIYYWYTVRSLYRKCMYRLNDFLASCFRFTWVSQLSSTRTVGICTKYICFRPSLSTHVRMSYVSLVPFIYSTCLEWLLGVHTKTRVRRSLEFSYRLLSNTRLKNVLTISAQRWHFITLLLGINFLYRIMFKYPLRRIDTKRDLIYFRLWLLTYIWWETRIALFHYFFSCSTSFLRTFRKKHSQWAMIFFSLQKD